MTSDPLIVIVTPQESGAYDELAAGPPHADALAGGRQLFPWVTWTSGPTGLVGCCVTGGMGTRERTTAHLGMAPCANPDVRSVDDQLPAAALDQTSRRRCGVSCARFCYCRLIGTTFGEDFAIFLS